MTVLVPQPTGTPSEQESPTVASDGDVNSPSAESTLNSILQLSNRLSLLNLAVPLVQSISSTDTWSHRELLLLTKGPLHSHAGTFPSTRTRTVYLGFTPLCVETMYYRWVVVGASCLAWW